MKRLLFSLFRNLTGPSYYVRNVSFRIGRKFARHVYPDRSRLGAAGPTGPEGPTGPVGAQGPGGGLVAWGVTALPVAAGTYRVAPWNEDIVALAGAFAWSSGCPLVLSCLTVRHNVPGGAAEDITYTLFVNGVASGLSVTLAANATYATSITPNVPIGPADEVELRASHTGLTSSPDRIVVTAAAGSQIFGVDYQRVDSPDLFTTGAGIMSPQTFVTKPGASLTTPALTGTYRLRWELLITASTANVNSAARLFNVTDGVIVPSVPGFPVGVQRFEPSSSSDEVEDMSKSALVIFGGAPKTFEIEVRKFSGPTPGFIECALGVIEIWRVG